MLFLNFIFTENIHLIWPGMNQDTQFSSFLV